MYTGQYVFAQVMEYLPWPVFRRCVARYGGDHKIKSFSCLDQFRCLAFAQLTWRESLRDMPHDRRPLVFGASFSPQAGFRLQHSGTAAYGARNRGASRRRHRDQQLVRGKTSGTRSDYPRRYNHQGQDP